ncbi:sensor histidine kinase [Nocardioides terrae]|uniref:sensor histidine kinase n=1 Tax=Nocardioides terrae TaxID=574651 RepID=UPI000B884E00|nr:histidine kinase [Nocardioides terrae]
MSSTSRSRAVLGVPLLDVVLAGLVVALSIGGLVSGDVDETPLALTLPVAVVIGLSLLGRTRAPLVATIVTTAANVLQGVWGNQSPGTLMALVVILLLAYSLGAEYDEGVASLGLGFMLAGMFLTEWLDSGSDYAFIAVELGGAWLLGRASRSWRSRATYAEQRQQDLARLAVANERARIARELHDVVAHSLSVIAVQADAAEAALARDPSRAGDPLRAIRGSAREALVDMRQLLHVLRSDDLTDWDGDPRAGRSSRAPARGLADLPPLVSGLREAGLPLDADVRVDGVSMPSGIELAVYRIVQEALTNVLKHAGAVPTRLTVEGNCDDVRVVVRNDPGRQARLAGIESDGRSGHGLIGVRERALAAGGTLQSGHTDDGGFELVATLPICGARA